MKIVLVDSPDVKESLAEEARDFLSQFPGPWKFEQKDKSVENPKYYEDEEYERGKAENIFELKPQYLQPQPKIEKWDNIFTRLINYRESNSIPNDVFILMYTAERNEHNWFGMFDLENRPQGFVQSSYWNEFVESESIYPILYETIAVPLQWKLMKNKSDAKKYLHYDPIGCINDFCENKREIILKLQTGNICQKCYDGFLESGLSEAEMDQIDTILDAIRLKFREFNQRRKKRKPLPVKVTHDGRKIYIGDALLKLRPLDKALYLFFLNKKKSIRTSDLPDHESKILDYYKHLYTGDSNTDMIRNIGRLVRNEDGVTNQAVSRINKSVDNLVIKELVDYYKIITDIDKYKSVKISALSDV